MDPMTAAALKIVTSSLFSTKKGKKLVAKYGVDFLADLIRQTLVSDKSGVHLTSKTKDIVDMLTLDPKKPRKTKADKEEEARMQKLRDMGDAARERLADPKANYNKKMGDYVWQDIIAPALSTGARELARLRTTQLGVLPSVMQAAAQGMALDPRVQQGTALGQLMGMATNAAPAAMGGINTARAVGTQAIANTFANTMDHAVGEARKEDELARMNKMINDQTLASGGAQPVSAYFDLENRILKNSADTQKKAAGGGF